MVFFVQGTMPAFDHDGKLLLADRDSLALSPDGHGGTLLALKRCGCLDRMKREGVEYLSYFQVDNPLVDRRPVVHRSCYRASLNKSRSVSASIIAGQKTGPFLENSAFFPFADGKLRFEYSDLPTRSRNPRIPDGSLRFSRQSRHPRDQRDFVDNSFDRRAMIP